MPPDTERLAALLRELLPDALMAADEMTDREDWEGSEYVDRMVQVLAPAIAAGVTVGPAPLDVRRLATLLAEALYYDDTLLSAGPRPVDSMSRALAMAPRLVAAGVTVGPARDDVAEYRAAAHRGSARVTVGPAPLNVERLARAADTVGLRMADDWWQEVAREYERTSP